MSVAGQSSGERFVELVDDDYVAEALARHSRGWGTVLRVGEDDEAGFDTAEPRAAETLPGGYEDVMFTSTDVSGSGDFGPVQWNGSTYLWSDISSVLWKGSLYRWHEGGVLLHWRTVAHAWEAYDFGG
jgi:hypothetical protein